MQFFCDIVEVVLIEYVMLNSLLNIVIEGLSSMSII